MKVSEIFNNDLSIFSIKTHFENNVKETTPCVYLCHNSLPLEIDLSLIKENFSI